MRKHLLFLICLLLVQLSGTARAVEVRLRNEVFDIPSAHLADHSFFEEQGRILGFDSGSSQALLLFSAKEIAKAVPGYSERIGKIEGDVLLLLSVLTPDEKAYALDPRRYSDEWFGKGRYSQRKLRTDQNHGWYKAYRKKESVDWTIFSVKPEGSLPKNTSDFLVARCLSGSAPSLPDGKLASCRVFRVIDSMMLEFKVWERNLPYVNDVARYLIEKVLVWRRNKRIP